MATSGTTSFTYTRDQYIKAALRKINVLSRFEEPEPEDITDGAEALNLFLATITDRSSDGSPNDKVWLKKSGAVISDRGRNRYTLGGSNANLAVALDDLIIRDLANQSSLTAGTNTVKSTITEDFTINHKAAIHYNDQGIHTSVISNYAADDNVLDEPDFDATGNWVTGTGWSIAGGVASCDGSQVSASNLSQSSVLTSGTRYAILTNVSAYTSGTLTPIAGTNRANGITQAGWNFQFITANGADFALEASASVDFIGSVTSVVVVPLTSALTFTLTTPFNRIATSADEVFFYTTEIDKPLDILTMSRRDRNGDDRNDSPMNRWNEAQYQALGDKFEEGDPVAYYYEEKLTEGYLYVDAINTNMRDILVFKYISSLQYFTAATDELDIPYIGREMIVYNLAKRLASEHDEPWTQENEDIRIEATSIWRNSDPEDALMFFEPDRVTFGHGFGGEFK